MILYALLVLGGFLLGVILSCLFWTWMFVDYEPPAVVEMWKKMTAGNAERAITAEKELEIVRQQLKECEQEIVSGNIKPKSEL